MFIYIFSQSPDHPSRRGFTLIEFLLYIGLVAILLLAVGAIGLNTLFSKAKLTTIEEVSQNARFAMEHIAETVRNAEAINSPTQGTSASTLSLQMASSTQNPTIFDLASSTLQIKEGVGAVIAITSDEVAVSSLQFTNVSYSSTPGTVRIQMTVNLVNPDSRQEYTFEKTFYTTANIRKR